MKAVIFIGAPGSGKGTQADLLSDEYGFFHLESSRIIEEKFAANPDDAVIREQQELWRTGKLVSSSLVRQWISERLESLAAKGTSVVLSGSPRTLEEAQYEVPLLERLFGERNLMILHLKLTREVSIRRNSSRRICKASRHPIPNIPAYAGLTKCPRDGSELITRELDTPETISVRYDTYLDETAPVLGFFAGKGYSVVDIDADNTIDAVHGKIAQALELGRRPVPEQ